MLKMLLLLLFASAQACINLNSEEDLFINSGTFALYLHQTDFDYHILVTDGKNKSTYSYPIQSELALAYNGEFTLNNQLPNIIDKVGIIKPPCLIKQLLTPIKRQPELPEQALQMCYEFTTERTSLKVVIGILALLFLASNGTKSWTFVRSISRDLLQSELTRRFSRARSPMARSQASHSSTEKESSG